MLELKSEIANITFPNTNTSLNNCELVATFNYSEYKTAPKFDIKIVGTYTGKVWADTELNFQAELFLADSGSLMLRAVMDKIYVDAFNLTQSINAT